MAVDIARQIFGLTYPQQSLLSPPYLLDSAPYSMPQLDVHGLPVSDYGDAGPSTAEHRKRVFHSKEDNPDIPTLPYPTPSGPTVSRRSNHRHRPTMDRPISQDFSQQTTHFASSISTDPISELAAFAAQMLNFIWFGPIKINLATTPVLLSRPTSPDGTGLNMSSSSPSFIPTSIFLRFCHDVLALTQVSHSVVLLALLYVYRLKAGNPSMQGEEGSEYRLLVTAILLANKYLDDNTYTNKTWSDVSNLPLKEINSMEVEFLRAVEHGGGLYTSEKTYYNWLKALEGLTFMKDCQTKKELMAGAVAQENAMREFAIKAAAQRARSLSPIAQLSDTQSRAGQLRNHLPPQSRRRNSILSSEINPNKRRAMQSSTYNDNVHGDSPASSVSPAASSRQPMGFESLATETLRDPFTFAQGFSASERATLLASFDQPETRVQGPANSATNLVANPLDLQFYSLAAGKRLGVGHHQQVDPRRASTNAVIGNCTLQNDRPSSYGPFPAFTYQPGALPASLQNAKPSPGYVQSLPTTGFSTPSNMSPLSMGQNSLWPDTLRGGQWSMRSMPFLGPMGQPTNLCLPSGESANAAARSTAPSSQAFVEAPRYTSAFANAGIPGVWMHGTHGPSSVSLSSRPHFSQHRSSQSVGSPLTGSSPSGQRLSPLSDRSMSRHPGRFTQL